VSLGDKNHVLLTMVLLLLSARSSAATTYFVGGKGSDSATGLSRAAAFRTLQHAADVTQPGDTVYALNGTYSNATPEGPVLNITNPGPPEHWITYAAYPAQKPLISFNGWAGVSFGISAAYIELRGFSVLGNNYNVTLEGALDQKNVSNPLYNGNCIGADGRKGTATQRPHHIRIISNEVRGCGGSGIGTNQSDYITIADNTVYDSSWYSIYGSSPISVNSSWNSDGFTGYKFFIVRNRIFGNRELVPWKAVGYVSDGEGIIIDTNRDKAFQSYAGRTLIADNVIYQNGSSAIQVFLSDHVDIVNNSTFDNVQRDDPKFVDRGEINLNDATDVNVIDNIIYSASNRNPVTIATKHPCMSCYVDYNVYFGGSNSPKTIGGAHDIFADPQYLRPTASERKAVDLRIRPSSPAAGSGTPWNESDVDAAGRLRTPSGSWDRGAYVSGAAR
jgi:hypothetical protein